MSLDERPLVLLGAGGHARVLVALAHAAGRKILGVCDPVLAADQISCWEGLDVLGNDSVVERFSPRSVALMLGVGQLVANTRREVIYDLWVARGYDFPILIHPAAWIAPNVVMGGGVQVMAGAIIQSGCMIGENCIINTRAGIDHDCNIGRNVHLAPGATLCGSVTVDDRAFIGAGATVIQGIRIGRNSVVGAGVTLVRDVTPKTVIVGAANRLR